MTNHRALYAQAIQKLGLMPKGIFRFNDLCDNPPANLGRVFRDDMVIRKLYPNVRRIGADKQSVLYEKF